MRHTLLEIVQDILNDLDSDNVNSINDTIEAQQVAQIVKSTYNKITSNRNWPNQKKLIQLNSLSDTNKPNYLKAPNGLKELILFKYDNRESNDSRILMRDVKYKHPDAFLRMVLDRDSTSEDVITVTDFGGTKLLIRKDCHPTFWTTFDDKYIVTDSYNADVETTLTASKTQILAYMESAWQQIDSFIPDLPSEAFAALIEEAKSTAFISLKQEINQKVEAEAQKQNRWLARKSWRLKGGIRYPDYGRKSRK